MPIPPALVAKKKPLSEMLGIITCTIERLMTRDIRCDRSRRAIPFDVHEVAPSYIQYRAKPTTCREQVDSTRTRRLRLETEIFASNLVRTKAEPPIAR